MKGITANLFILRKAAFQNILAMAITVSILPNQGKIFAQAGKGHVVHAFASPRPLSQAADMLQRQFGKPVTYEDPVLIWLGDMERNARGNGLVPRRRSFSVQLDEGGGSARGRDVRLASMVLDAYLSQTAGPRFRLIESPWGLHFVPAKVRDADGHFIEARGLLDAYISVPTDARTPEGHFEAICAAVSNSTGIKLEPHCPWIDRYFAPNGIHLPNILSDEDIKKISFVWGTATKSAREALTALLGQSATTLSWRLLCEAGEGYCVLNLLAIEIYTLGPDGRPVRKPVFYDRIRGTHP